MRSCFVMFLWLVGIFLRAAGILLATASLLLMPQTARAQEPPPEKVIAPNAIHVCVKPSWLNVDSNYWSYGPGDMPVKLTIAKFKERTQGHNTYVYDPWAPPENTALLPPPDNQLECAVAPPRPDKAAKKPADKPGDGGQAEKTTGKGNGTKPGAEKKEDGADKPKKPTPEEEARIDDELKDLRSQAELEALARQRCRGEKLPCAKDHPLLPDANEHPALPMKKRVLPDQEDASQLPSAKEESELPLAKAYRGVQTPMAGAGGDSTKTAEEARRDMHREAWEKAMEDMAILEAMLSQRMNEELRSKDGKKYGVVGGKNPDGIDHPAAQAVAVAVMITVQMVSPDQIRKKVTESLEKKAPLVIKEVDEAWMKWAGKLDKDPGLKESIVAEISKAEMIAPLKFMKRLTDKLKGTYHAHHIIEEHWARKLKMGDVDEIPSVILNQQHHQDITRQLGKLANWRRTDMTKEKLWEIYKGVYKDHPHWLEAIKGYFK